MPSHMLIFCACTNYVQYIYMCVCVEHLKRCKTSTYLDWRNCFFLSGSLPWQWTSFEYFTRRLSNLLFKCRGRDGWFPSHANEAMEINWMEVWTQTSVPAVSLLGAFKSQLGDTSYCVFCRCFTALPSDNQTSTWGLLFDTVIAICQYWRFVLTLFRVCSQLAPVHAENSCWLSFESDHHLAPVRFYWGVFARAMHSTSEFAKMFLSKWVCACVYIFIYLFMYLFIYLCIYLFIYLFIYTHVYSCMHVCTSCWNTHKYTLSQPLVSETQEDGLRWLRSHGWPLWHALCERTSPSMRPGAKTGAAKGGFEWKNCAVVTNWDESKVLIWMLNFWVVESFSYWHGSSLWRNCTIIWHDIYVYIHITSMRVLFLHFISRELPSSQVDNLLAELQGQTQKLKVNAVGLSRGGIACSYLAQVMSDIPASRCWVTMLNYVLDDELNGCCLGWFFEPQVWQTSISQNCFKGKLTGDMFSNIWYSAKTKMVVQLYEHVLESQSNPVPVMCVQSNWKSTNYSVLGLFGFGFGGTWLPDPRWNSWFVHGLFIWQCWP